MHAVNAVFAITGLGKFAGARDLGSYRNLELLLLLILKSQHRRPVLVDEEQPRGLHLR